MSGAAAYAPLYLLADSQPLFAGAGGPSILERASPALSAAPRAAYLGAANGDEAVFYDLFSAAMDGAGIEDRAMVHSRYDEADRARLAAADLVVLAGGDVERGWRIFMQSGIREALLARYAAGAVLLGVSAGAVHLGWGYLGLVPAHVGAHEEGDRWDELRRRMRRDGGRVRGLGVAAGGALVADADGGFEPLRRAAVELVFGGDGDEIGESLLLPA